MNTVAIGDSNLKIADGNYSAKYPRSEEFVSEGVPFIRGNNFENKSISDKNMYFISPEKHSELKKGHVKPKDVLITTRGNIGKVALVPERHDDSNINSQLVLLRCNEGWHPEYLLHTFNSKFVTRQIPALITGSALKQLSVKNLKKLKIPLPPLDQQKKIAAILDAADAYRQKTKALIEKYDELTQSLFLDMFGDPVGNPKGWEKVPTIKYCDCIVPGRDKPKSFTGNLPWITTGDLRYLGFMIKSRLNIGLSKDEISEVRAKIIPKNSVIMTCVGDLGVVSINTNDIVMNQQLHAFICHDELNNVFLMHNLSYQTPYMNKMASSTTVPYMNKTVANNTPTIVPPIVLQNQFAGSVQAIEAQKAQAQASLAQAEDLFNSLLQRAFKGELV